MPASLMIAALALAACGESSEDRAATASAEAPAPAMTGNPAPATVPAGKTLAAGDWSVGEDATGVAATFAEAGSQPQLTVRCDRAARQIAIEKPGALQPGEEYSIIAGGERFILPMQSTTNALPTMSAQVHPQQPILASIALPGTSFILLGPGMTETVLPAAPGIRRVIDTCLNS